MSKVIDYINTHQDQAVEDLFEFLRIPSISTQPQHKPDILLAAKWLQSRLSGMDLQTELIETLGHPLVFAQSKPQPGKPTLLIYGHYDVQPADPLDEWLSQPFEPTVRDGIIFARGASDDKGQLMCHLKAVQAWMAAHGKLPLNIKFILEGEEECSGNSLQQFICSDKSRLAADYVLISDGSQLAPGIPARHHLTRGGEDVIL